MAREEIEKKHLKETYKQRKICWVIALEHPAVILYCRVPPSWKEFSDVKKATSRSALESVKISTSLKFTTNIFHSLRVQLWRKDRFLVPAYWGWRIRNGKVLSITITFSPCTHTFFKEL